MPTARTVTIDALRALRVLAVGDDPSADEMAASLAAVNALILDLHEARGPLIDVDVAGDYIAGEDQRVRVQAGAEGVVVTLPNSVPIYRRWDPYDYGFSAPAPFLPAQGSTGAADGVTWRQPRDGARVEVVGTTQGLWFYRADTNAWLNAVNLALDDELPLNARYAGPLAALLSERLLDVIGSGQLTPGLTRRIARGNAALMLRPGTARDPVRAEYF
jgi:hypothetical protein